MEDSAVRIRPVSDLLEPVSERPSDVRTRGVIAYQGLLAEADRLISDASAWAAELVAVPPDQRREVAELASRMRVLMGEVQRLA
jgi:hypothetical protein